MKAVEAKGRELESEHKRKATKEQKKKEKAEEGEDEDAIQGLSKNEEKNEKKKETETKSDVVKQPGGAAKEILKEATAAKKTVKTSITDSSDDGAYHCECKAS